MKKVHQLSSAARKAWVVRFHKERGWDVKQIRQWTRERYNEDIEPRSLRAYLKGLAPKGRTRSMRGRRITNHETAARRGLQKELDRAEEQLEHAGDFNPRNKKDARKKVLQAIVRRRGQSKFRQQLLVAYGYRCPITKCDLPDALEAAHIRPYLGEKFNYVQNGLLLRSDIHTLFDLGKIGINADTKRVMIAKSLKGTVYESMKGALVRFPKDERAHPNEEVLREHARSWGLKLK